MKTKLLLFAALACSIAIMANESKQDLAQRRATVEKLNEENPNNCVVVGAMFFQNDTVPTEKSDYYYDKDKVMIASFDYEMRDTGWHCRRYCYYDHIFLPYDTTDITFTHSWNYDDSTWYPVSGSKIRYITNGNVVTMEIWHSSAPDTTQWKEYKKSISTYDEQGREIEQIDYDFKDDAWVENYKYEYAYNENDERIYYAYFIWKNGAWQVRDMQETKTTDTTLYKASYYYIDHLDSLQLTNYVYYKYDAQGNVLLYIWGADGDRIYQKYIYGYEDGKPVWKEFYKEADYPPYDLILTERSTYETDAQNRIINAQTDYFHRYGTEVYRSIREMTTYAYDDDKLPATSEQHDSIDGTWVPTSRTEYTYNANRQQTCQISLNYNQETQVWVNSTKVETTFNSNDLLLSQATYNWDAEKNRWQGQFKFETEYNEQDFPIAAYNFMMPEGDTVWVAESAIVRMFDVYGNFLGEGWYGCDENGNWVNKGKQLMSYVCGDIPTASQPVIAEPGYDFVTFAWLSYEDAETYTLTVKSADQKTVIAIMHFNAYGQLIDTQTPESPRRRAAMASSSSVFTCQIEGLESGTEYFFSMVAKDAEEEVIETSEGTFSTEGESAAIETTLSETQTAEKILQDGRLLIRHQDHWYNAIGTRIQ